MFHCINRINFSILSIYTCMLFNGCCFIINYYVYINFMRSMLLYQYLHVDYKVM